MKFRRKHRAIFSLVAFIAFGLLSVIKFDDYFNDGKKSLSLVAAISFGLASLLKIGETVYHYRKRNQLDKKLLNNQQNPEECDAIDDDSSTEAGQIKRQ